jgi:hypothetical protein
MKRLTFDETRVGFWKKIGESSMFALDVGLEINKYLRTLKKGQDGVFLEFPSLSRENEEDIATVMLIPTNAFTHVMANHTAFETYMEKQGDNKFVVFPSLGGDGLLLVPTLKLEETPYDSCAHVARFMLEASAREVICMWKKLAEVVLERHADPTRNGAPIYVSTHGKGVPWLHMRICDTPKYYVSDMQHL